MTSHILNSLQKSLAKCLKTPTIYAIYDEIRKYFCYAIALFMELLEAESLLLFDIGSRLLGVLVVIKGYAS